MPPTRSRRQVCKHQHNGCLAPPTTLYWRRTSLRLMILRDILEDRTMQRRTIRLFITLALAAAPLAAVAQPAGKVHKIGFLNQSSATAMARQFEAFTQGLRELGYIEGENIAI